ncbi:ribosomal L1 domain-containing protein 1 [Brachypodium distachyon]|nr:ribosomal L1 domain-containing protein 1 [Brachypodium distachyon]|eukprot:XP_003581392.1 ribosomal L1 domain-containing protein 1 [Brachypodium distachyon]
MASAPATAAPNPERRVRREAVVRAAEALLRWLQHHASPAPEPIYLLVTLKSPPVRRFEHHLRLPLSPFPSVFLVSDRLPDVLPDDIEPLPSSALRSLPAVARRGLVLVDGRLRIPNSGKASKGRGRLVPVDLADPAWADSAREAARCVELRVEAGTCRAVRVGHAAMAQAEVVENVMAAVEAAAACVPRKWKNVRALHLKAPESIALPLYSASVTSKYDNAAKDAKLEGATVAEQVKRRKKE